VKSIIGGISIFFKKTFVFFVFFLLLSPLMFFSFEVEAQANWLSGWKYRRKIVINHEYIDNVLLDFPVLVYIKKDSLLRDYAQSDGDDICFYNKKGNIQYNHEIERYNSDTGELIAWVNITEVKSDEDTVFYLYFGNPDVDNQENKEKVWNSDYLAVFHMNQSSGYIWDSTGYKNNFAKSGTHYYQQTGKIGYGIKGDDATSKFYNNTLDLRNASGFTFECWYNVDTYSSIEQWFLFTSKWSSAADIRLAYFNNNTNMGFMSYYEDGDSTDGCDVRTHVFSDNSWQYYATTLTNESTGEIIQYLNESDECNDTSVDYDFQGLDNVHSIGYRYINNNRFYRGILDEIRISRVKRNSSWIKASFHSSNQTKDFLIYSDVSTESWYDISWKYRKLITINHNYVDSDLKNFPIWFYNVSDDFKGTSDGGCVQYDGDDFVFVSFDNTVKYNHEIELYDNATGEVGIWVNVTRVKSDEDTYLWVYYGNSEVSNQENISGVWDSNFTGVWHFKENPGVAGNDSIFDSSYPHYNGTDQGDMDETDRVDAITGYGFHLDGVDDRIEICVNETGDIADVLADDDVGTVEFWIKRQDSSGIVVVLNDYNEAGDYLYFSYGGTPVRLSGDLGVEGDWRPRGETNITTTAWYYFTYASNDTYNFFYLNGTTENVTWEQGSNDGTWFNNTGDGQDSFTIGAIIREGGNTGFCNATIDEVRISDKRRNDSWIKATYYTNSNPSLFISVGDTEKVGISFSNPNPPSGAVNVEPLSPVSITVNESDGNPMNLTWYWNDSGVWKVFGVNNSVYNGTYSQVNSNFSENLTTYYWKVYAESVADSKYSDVYYFTTRPSLVPDPPTNVSTKIYFDPDALNITWTKGNRSDYTLIVRKNGSYPENISDGTVIYNDTGTWYNDTGFVSGMRYKLYAYNATGKYYSTGVKARYGALDIYCYNESNTSQGLTFNVFISDKEGTKTYVETNCTNPHTIDINLCPTGYNISIKINSTGYKDRIYYMDLFPGNYYTLNAYLPPENKTKLYFFTVIDETDRSVAHAKLTVMQYINETVGYENITSVLTDGYGQTSVMLMPNFMYKIILEKPKFKRQVDDFFASPDDFTHIFRMYYLTPSYRNLTLWQLDITFEGYINVSDSKLYVNYSDYTKNTSLVKFVVIEYNTSTNEASSIYYLNTSDNELSFNISVNTSNKYRVEMDCTHNFHGAIYHFLEFYVQPKITTKTRFNMLFEANYGTNPFGWSNFIGFMVVIACMFSFGERGCGIGLIGTGMCLLFINNIIGFTTIAVVVPIVFVILGILVEWSNRQRGVLP